VLAFFSSFWHKERAFSPLVEEPFTLEISWIIVQYLIVLEVNRNPALKYMQHLNAVNW